MPIPLDDKTRAVQAYSTFVQLLQYDQIWTDHLSKQQPISDRTRDNKSLQIVSERISRLLIDARQEAAALKDIVEKYAKDIDQQLPDLLSQAPKQVADKFMGFLSRNGGFVPVILKGCRILQERSREARDEIERKMDAIISRTSIEGDLPKWVTCASYAAGMGAAAAAAFGGAGSPASAAGVAAWLGLLAASNNLSCWDSWEDEEPWGPPR